MYLVQSRHRPATRGITGLSEAVVDLSAIRDNVRAFRQRVPQGVLAVVKADAFGHGAVPVARAAVEAGATWLGVARADEALQLRAAGLTVPILTWLYDAAELMLLGDMDVDVSVSTVAELQRVASIPSVHYVHLKLDTGLHRAGSAPDQWIELTRTAAHYEALGAVTVRGIWSHLSHGDSADAVQSTRQLQLLRTGVGLARRAGLRPSVVHLANSAGAITLDAPDCNLVRIGAGLYGIDEVGLGLRPVMRLVSKLAQVRRIRAGEGVSYGHDFVADRDTTIGLVPIGYADGIPRVAVRQASVLCHGVRMPVIGRIAMDQFVVDAGEVAVEPGEPVTIFGDGSAGEPTASDWADWAGTIPHEIYCGIGSRVPRRYEVGNR
ncbi:alanine racemase [Kribbella jiaozuonensis]|uniref:Alanine racemase n=1 Tax=Kribbella jiaozuonensis TaxID=2575441 RepID=A0A4U3M0J5_9ACTN|nr:alanine racemase [Kribbella jiaozuonensis]TKK81632.1 alanine racemase [Kribbella jiaozuonensis]